ncbi:MAG: hypothetical protein ACLR7Z_20180 [Bilophila wadsworthia]
MKGSGMKDGERFVMAHGRLKVVAEFEGPACVVISAWRDQKGKRAARNGQRLRRIRLAFRGEGDHMLNRALFSSVKTTGRRRGSSSTIWIWSSISRWTYAPCRGRQGLAVLRAAPCAAGGGNDVPPPVP